MKFTLRPYQQKAIDDLWAAFAKHPSESMIVEAAVGAGKSAMIAEVARRANEEYPGTRILVIVHQKELLQQNVARFRDIWPGADVGVFSASAGRKELGRLVTYATIGSIYKRAHEMGRIDIVLCDECHLISTSGEGIWRKFLSDLRMTCPSFCTIGWTGTPFRGNGVWLTAGKDPLFTKVVARVGMRQLLDDGYLSPLTPMITQSRIDVSDVRMSGDDYAINALAKATDTDALVQSTAAEICALFADRKRWLVFAVTVEHAEHMRDAIRTHGIKAQMVSANTPAAERDRIITDYRAGRERCLVNVAVLTTGFDVPEVDAIALLRATKSPVLITQIAGRGMRLAPGKTDCAWADFSNSTEMLGPIDEIKGRLPTTKATGDAPFRICPGCGSRCAAGASECAECGHVFPPPERIKHGDTARGAAVLSEHVAREVERAVTRVTYARHNKTFSMISSEDPPPTLRVEYWDGVEVVAKEWVSLEHGGYPRLKAERWWRDRTPSGSPAPRTVDEAIVRANQGEVRSPLRIGLTKRPGTRHSDISTYHWA